MLRPKILLDIPNTIPTSILEKSYIRWAVLPTYPKFMLFKYFVFLVLIDVTKYSSERTQPPSPLRQNLFPSVA